MILYLRQNFLCKELLHSVGGDRVEGVVYGYAHALLAVTHAEGAAQLDLVADVVLGNEVLKLCYDLARALDVAGATDTNCDFQHTFVLSCLKKFR